MLKRLAVQKLQEKMAGNSLNAEATSSAATEGAGALLESLKGGDLSQITALFGGAGSAEGSGVMQNVQGKLKEILQAKGMNEQEAETEASTGAADLISGLKEKFQSQADEDKGFDLNSLSGLWSGDAGDLLNKAKNLLG